jgi:hypothetical protein
MKLLTLFSFLFIFGCAQEAPKTNMKISIGAVTGSANFPGGLVLGARNINTGEGLTKIVPPNDTTVLELPNGQWRFSILGWQGSNNMEGTPFCDRKVVELTGGDFPLNLVATNAKCITDKIFGDDVNAGEFYHLDLQSCGGIKNHIAAGETIPGNLSCGNPTGDMFAGNALSYKVSILESSTVNGINNNVFLRSECQDVSSFASTGPTLINIPYGQTATGGGVVIRIEAYPQLTCAGVPTFHFMPDAFKKAAVDNSAAAIIDNATNTIKVFTNSSLCDASNETSLPFARGNSTFQQYLICSAAQFENIAKTAGGCPVETGNNDPGTMDCEVDATYILGNTIDYADLGGNNTTIANAFSGTLQGNFNIIKNGDTPLFDTLKTHATKDTRIGNLKIENFGINYGSIGSINVGILASNLSSSASGKRIEIHDIKINNTSHITVNDTGGWSGGVGALIGKIDFNSTPPASGGYAFIRKISSHANVSVTTDTASPGMVGGIVGDVFGSSVAGTGVSFELNEVGYDDINDNFDTYRVSLISISPSGDTRVGGLVGKARYLDIREGNIASSTVNARARVGGIIGDSQTDMKISNSTGDLVFVPNGNSSRVGGVIGSIATYTTNIDGVTGKVKINSPVKTDLVGGLIGTVGTVATSSTVNIKNSKGIVDIDNPGSSIGGFMGAFSATASGGNTITSSVAEGVIKDTGLNATSTKRGGFVGESTFAKLISNISTVDIQGYAFTGGAFGISTETILQEAYIDSDIIAYTTGASVNIGGITGQSNGTSGGYTSIKLVGSIYVPNRTCDTGVTYCGLLTGENTSTTFQVYNDVITLMSAGDSGAGFTYQCFPTGNCTGTEIGNINTTDGASCTPLGADFSYSTVCDLNMEKKWKEYGYDTPSSRYLAGSLIDPFEINTPDEWNKIGDDTFLVKKYFKLMDNLDFSLSTFPSGGVYVPIGTDNSGNTQQIFSGGIVPNTKKLYNIISHSLTGTTSAGLFPFINGARIGLRHDPLRIEDSSFISDTNNSGIIGAATQSEISIHAKNIVISNGSATEAVGGILGFAGANVRMNNSFFQGRINVAGASKVGGLVGMVKEVSGDSVHIEDSFVNLEKIIGSAMVGGLIGSAYNTDTVSIKNSYVWLDKFDAHGTYGVEDDIAGGAFAAALIGRADLAGDLRLENVYADISNATLGTGTVCLLGGVSNGIGPTYSEPIAIVEGSTTCTQSANDNTISGTIPRFLTHQLMADDATNPFEYDNRGDWWMDNGSLRLSWENPSYVPEL